MPDLQERGKGPVMCRTPASACLADQVTPCKNQLTSCPPCLPRMLPGSMQVAKTWSQQSTLYMYKPIHLHKCRVCWHKAARVQSGSHHHH